MYCEKCGKNLNDSALFCPVCGAKTRGSENDANSGKSVNINFTVSDFNDIKDKAGGVKESFLTGVDALGKNKTLFFVNIVFLALSMIFSFTEIFEVKVGLLGLSDTEGMSMFDDSVRFIQVLFVMAYIASFVFLLVPLPMNKIQSTKFYLPTKITTISLTVWFLFILIAVGSEAQKQASKYSADVSFYLTATGWMFVITTLAALVLTFKLSMNVKKAINNNVFPYKGNTYGNGTKRPM